MDPYVPNQRTQLIETARGDTTGSGYVNLPLQHASTYSFRSVEDYQRALKTTQIYGEEKYARIDLPSVVAFEKAMAELEGGFAARATSSGLSAISTALLAVAEPGCHILMPKNVYLSTISFCEKFLRAKLGVDVEYYDPMNAAQVIGLFREETQILYLEAPGSYTFEVPDLETLIKAADEEGICTIADNTWSGSIFLKPMALGCDIVVSSASKYICGHSDAILGVIVANEAHFEAIRRTARLLGQNPSPDAVFLALRGLRTLPMRMAWHQTGAEAVCHWLSSQDAIARVFHVADPDHPGHQTWRTHFSGYSGLFGIEFASHIPIAQVHKFIDQLKLFRLGSSWGGFESLIIPTFPEDFPADHPASSGRLCRIHVGLEDPEDLIGDLEHSLTLIQEHA
ncbi:MAG: PLP-dependent aspartate aminotransferase family protein [Paracoccaceae bacterium]